MQTDLKMEEEQKKSGKESFDEKMDDIEIITEETLLLNSRFQTQRTKISQTEDTQVRFEAPEQIRIEKEPERLTGKEAKKKREELTKNRKEKEGLPLDREEMEQVKRLAISEWGKQNWMTDGSGSVSNIEIMQEIKEKKYFGHFEKLDIVFRDYLATQAMQDFNEKYLNDYSGAHGIEVSDDVAKQIVDRLVGEDRLFDPLLRVGLSQYANYEEKEYNNYKNVYRKVDNEITKRIMIRTLTYEMRDIDKNRYKREGTSKLSFKSKEEQLEEARKLEKAKRSQMAKQFMLMQLGKLYIVDTKVKKTAEVAEVPLASVVAHCSRVVVTTPRLENDEEEEMWNSILRQYRDNGKGEKAYYNDAQIKRRGASTHQVTGRAAGGLLSKEEKKYWNFSGQTGMNVAIGGLGSSGVGGRMVNQDGSGGHVYGMHKESGNGRAGVYLFGYESDAYSHTNALGHTHDLLATGERSSSFLSQRTDEIGDKYGGRQADLSIFHSLVIVKLMNKIDEIYLGNDQDKIKIVSEKLCGNVMSRDEFLEFLKEDLGFKDDKNFGCDYLADARENNKMKPRVDKRG